MKKQMAPVWNSLPSATPSVKEIPEPIINQKHAVNRECQFTTS